MCNGDTSTVASNHGRLEIGDLKRPTGFVGHAVPMGHAPQQAALEDHAAGRPSPSTPAASKCRVVDQRSRLVNDERVHARPASQS